MVRLEGMATSVLPDGRDTITRVLTAPAMEAKFAQYLLEVASGGGTEQTLRGTPPAARRRATSTTRTCTGTSTLAPVGGRRFDFMPGARRR